MQSDYHQIYKLTAERTGKSESIYKDIGNLVFKSLSDNMKRPKKLIFKLKGIGYWYLRRNRIIATIEMFPPDSDKQSNETPNLSFDKVEIHALFKERIKDYDKYVEQKSEIRKKRNETQTLLKPEEN